MSHEGFSPEMVLEDKGCKILSRLVLPEIRSVAVSTHRLREIATRSEWSEPATSARPTGPHYTVYSSVQLPTG